MKKIYKFGIAIFILMMFYELNSSVVYAGHTSTCKATATTGAYQKYEYSSGTRHNVKSYCNDCDGYLYQQPGDCNISSGDCKNEKKCSLCKHSFGYGDHNYENNGYCNGKKCSICSGTTGYTSHSYGSYVNYSDTQHRKKCSRSGCRNQYSYQAHSLSSSYTVTADTHTLVTSCSDCTYSTTGTAQDHTGGTKSCFAKAICSVCSEPYGGYNDHTWYNYTYFSESLHKKTCSVCFTNPTESHDWVAATCTTAKYCRLCGYEDGNPLNHTGGTHANGGKCTRSGCGVIYQTHSNSNSRKRYDTSDTQHWPIYSCSYNGCSYEYLGTKVDHSGGKATCQERAICSTCNKVYGDYGSHSYSNSYTVDTKPTCTAAGSESQHCTIKNCTATRNSRAVPATGHNWVSDGNQKHKCNNGCGATGNHEWDTNHKCTVCKYQGTHDYSIATDQYYPCASPVTEHERTYLCICGSSTRKNFAHTYNTGDSTHHQCIYCLAKLAHNWGAPYAKVSESQHSKTCSDCSAKTNEAHNSNTRQANCTQKAICSLCNSEWGSINASNHNYKNNCLKCGTANARCTRSDSHIDSHDCSIYVTPPTVTTIHRWKETSIRAVAEHSRGYYTLSGNPTATNVGTYTATATLKPGTEPTYRWSDTRGTEKKTFTWHILDIPVGTITGPNAVQKKENETATFKVDEKEGTHKQYQWYYNTTNSSTGGTKIDNATNAEYSVVVNRNMNNRYFYCVISNNSESSTSLTPKASGT
ncbi:MAG: hypothetical protein IKK43_03220, partial [Clostridia bacterium]|nr:hypothetical protein [Clostridia bacterium]